MSTEIKLPQLGFSMAEGLLQEWLVPDGGNVTEGAPLYTLESDKSAQEIEAPASGILKIIAPPGETYSVGTLLGVIE
jgi:pyruvate/2-oxoglutarate dehydrogenase complex dihydrolipoamide acyltransferase (E2) component